MPPGENPGREEECRERDATESAYHAESISAPGGGRFDAAEHAHDGPSEAATHDDDAQRIRAGPVKVMRRERDEFISGKIPSGEEEHAGKGGAAGCCAREGALRHEEHGHVAEHRYPRHHEHDLERTRRGEHRYSHPPR